MLKSLWFFLAVLLVIVAAFWYFETTPVIAPASLENAESSDRCAQFREYEDKESEVHALGYRGRIRQLLHGCF